MWVWHLFQEKIKYGVSHLVQTKRVPVVRQVWFVGLLGEQIGSGWVQGVDSLTSGPQLEQIASHVFHTLEQQLPATGRG